MESNEQSPQHDATAFADRNVVAIPSLNPLNDAPPSLSIRAVVTLIWPFSSRSRSTAVLLAERDFRLRRNKGQVRVQLTGAAAVGFVQSGVGIGDEVQVSLAGAKWIQEDNPVKTPGRCVEGELLFNHKFLLHLQRNGNSTTAVEVDEPEPVQSVPPDVTAAELELGPEEGINGVSVDDGPQPNRIDEWSSPAFLRSGTAGDVRFTGWEYDPFADDSEVLVESPRKRTKFGRPSNEWRYVEDDSPTENVVAPDSPGEELSTAAVDAEAIVTEPMIETPTRHRASAMQLPSDPEATLSTQEQRIQPPPFPPLTTKPSLHLRRNLRTPSPPRLQLLQSPGLPLPSLFPTPTQRHLQRLSMEEIYVSHTASSSGEMTMNQPHSVPHLFAPSHYQNMFQTIATTSDETHMERQRQVSYETFADSNLEASGYYEGEAQVEDITVTLSEQKELTARLVPSISKEDEVVDLLSDSESEREAEDNGREQSSPVHTQPSTIELGDRPSSTSAPGSRDWPRRAQEHTDSITSSEAVVRSTYGAESELDGRTAMHQLLDNESFYEEPQSVTHPSALTQAEEADAAPPGHRKTGSADFEDFFTFSPISPSKPPQEKPDTAPVKTAAVPMNREFEHSIEHVPVLPFQAPPITPENSQQPREYDPGYQVPVETIPVGHPPLTPLPSELELAHAMDGASEQMNEVQPSRPQRRSTRLHRDDVPEDISQWFTSRRKSRAHVEHSKISGPNEQSGLGAAAQHKDRPEAEEKEEPASESIVVQQPRTGFRTPLSYYSPLSSLRESLNNSASQTGNTVDVMAVIMDIQPPKRAKYGPKDHYAVLHVSDPSISPKHTLVECFRPWKKSLPAAEAGDVALMRGFQVKSRKNACYLLSSDLSGWLIWRYPKDKQSAGTDEQPVSAQQANGDGFAMVREECKGPPVEIGEDERRQAHALRHWWLTVERDETSAKRHSRTRSRGGSGNVREVAHANGVATSS